MGAQGKSARAKMTGAFSNPETYDAVAKRFKALADPTRLRILHELASGPQTVSGLVTATETSQPNVSKHLSTLLGEGLVERNRDGSSMLYTVKDPSVYDLCDLVCGSVRRRAAEAHRLLSA